MRGAGGALRVAPLGPVQHDPPPPARRAPIASPHTQRFGALFDEVHRSNMSKACATRAEAERTVEHYAKQEQPARIEEVRSPPGAPRAHCSCGQRPAPAQAEGKFLVYRIADSKVLKSVDYSPADLAAKLGKIDLENKQSN